MFVFINDNLTELPKEITTIAQLVDFKKIKPGGTAIALNNKIIKKENWPVTPIENNDRITVITAAFGG